jgi:hypothetical protein
MTPEFIERVKRDYAEEKSVLDWDSYLAGYWAAIKRFGEHRERKESRREIKSKLGYSRIGLNNV